jgi:phosphate transport system substrate-binding protein
LNSSPRRSTARNSDDNTLVNGVAGDPDGLGYFGYAYYAANAETLHALAIKNGDDAPVVRPSPETILDKTYAPLSRPLFIYVKKSTLTRPGVAAFVTYYLDHVAEVAPKAKYVAPTAEDIKANKEALDAILGPKKGPTA